MSENYETRQETGVFLLCKKNLRKFQSDLLAIFLIDKYNKTIKIIMAGWVKGLDNGGDGGC